MVTSVVVDEFEEMSSVCSANDFVLTFAAAWIPK